MFTSSIEIVAGSIPSSQGLRRGMCALKSKTNAMSQKTKGKGPVGSALTGGQAQTRHLHTIGLSKTDTSSCPGIPLQIWLPAPVTWKLGCVLRKWYHGVLDEVCFKILGFLRHKGGLRETEP